VRSLLVGCGAGCGLSLARARAVVQAPPEVWGAPQAAARRAVVFTANGFMSHVTNPTKFDPCVRGVSTLTPPSQARSEAPPP